MLSKFMQLGRQISGGLFSWLPSDTWIARWTGGANHLEDLGRAGENVAARFLWRQGYRILERGHRQRLGEIDLIALDGRQLVFVEVKTWRSDDHADPAEAVDFRKQEKLTRAALTYLKEKQLLEQPARFDVVSIVWPEDQQRPSDIRHFVNAFEAVGHGQFFR